MDKNLLAGNLQTFQNLVATETFATLWMRMNLLIMSFAYRTRTRTDFQYQGTTVSSAFRMLICPKFRQKFKHYKLNILLSEIELWRQLALLPQHSAIVLRKL